MCRRVRGEQWRDEGRETVGGSVSQMSTCVLEYPLGTVHSSVVIVIVLAAVY